MLIIAKKLTTGKWHHTSIDVFEFKDYNICIDTNKMDRDTDDYKQERHDEISLACNTVRQKEEEECGWPISLWHHSSIEVSGNNDFNKDMIRYALQDDDALIKILTDGTFITEIARRNHNTGGIQGQTSQHMRVLCRHKQDGLRQR